MGIKVVNLGKRFGNFQAIDNVNFEVEQGHLVALLGPSGSGKSTILRVIAGLEEADEGEVYLTGEDASTLPVQKRGIGFVFQHYALFRHMTVRQNIAFGLEVQRRPKEEIKQRVEELLKMVQLNGYANRLPHQLSGGQRQRVALARALAPRPRVLLLDEPFGALDAKVRMELREWLRHMHDEFAVTSLFVTHDQEEALAIADEIIIVNKGRIEQIGSPREVYENPKTAFVTSFLGPVNVLRGRALNGMVHFEAHNLKFPISVDNSEAQEGNDQTAYGASAYVRPHDLEIEREPALNGAIAKNGHALQGTNNLALLQTSASTIPIKEEIGEEKEGTISTVNGNSLPAKVRRVYNFGPAVRVEMNLLSNGETLAAELTRERFTELGIGPGDLIYVTPREMRIFVDDYSI